MVRRLRRWSDEDTCQPMAVDYPWSRFRRRYVLLSFLGFFSLLPDSAKSDVSALRPIIPLLLLPLDHLLSHTSGSSGGQGDEDVYKAELQIVEISARILQSLSDNRDWAKSLASTLPDTRSIPLRQLLDFVEHATLPAIWTLAEDQETDAGTAEEDALTRAEAEKTLGKAKASLITAVVSLSGDVGHEPEIQWFWTRMREWIRKGSERSDLVCCGLLSFGNRAQEVQHAFVGLLRNLSIPPENKAILGGHKVVDGLVGMGVWKQERDMVGSVQGGAIGVIKNLCRGNVSTSESFMTNQIAISELLGLIKRTDDAALQAEGIRIFVNCIRSVSSSSSPDRQSMVRLCNEDIVTLFAELLRSGGKYPVLVNEAVVSLALAANSGEGSCRETVLRCLLKPNTAISETETETDAEPSYPHTVPPTSAMKVIVYLLAPTDTAPDAPKIGREIQENVVTLVRLLAASRVPEADEMKREIRDGLEGKDAVADGVRDLIAEWK
ncbi:hypothetical protein P7C73_g498, partial [Tremellales sp. Uapishka_1]